MDNEKQKDLELIRHNIKVNVSMQKESIAGKKSLSMEINATKSAIEISKDLRDHRNITVARMAREWPLKPVPMAPVSAPAFLAIKPPTGAAPGSRTRPTL